MVNIKNTTIATDGQMVRVSTMYDVLDDEGKNTSTNNRITRAVTDKQVLEAIGTINAYILNSIKEE